MRCNAVPVPAALILILIAAAVIATVSWLSTPKLSLPRESFSEGRAVVDPNANENLNAQGEGIINDACTVAVSDANEPHRLRGFTYLERHPRKANTCIFRANKYDVRLMDARMSQCSKEGYLYDSSVVDSIGVSEGDVYGEGRKMCEIAFKAPSTTRALVDYQTSVRTKALQLTPAYGALELRKEGLAKELTRLDADSASLRADIVKAERSITGSSGLLAENTRLERQSKELQDQIDGIYVTRREKDALLNEARAENARLAEQRAAADAMEAAARAEYDNTAAKAQSARDEVARLRAMLAEKQALKDSRSVTNAEAEVELARTRLEETKAGIRAANLRRRPGPYDDRNWLVSTEFDGLTRDSYNAGDTMTARDCAQKCADRYECHASSHNVRTGQCKLYPLVRGAVKVVSEEYDSWVKYPEDVARSPTRTRNPPPPGTTQQQNQQQQNQQQQNQQQQNQQQQQTQELSVEGQWGTNVRMQGGVGYFADNSRPNFSYTNSGNNTWVLRFPDDPTVYTGKGSGSNGTVEVLDFGGNNRWLRGGASSAGQPAMPAGQELSVEGQWGTNIRMQGGVGYFADNSRPNFSYTNSGNNTWVLRFPDDPTVYTGKGSGSNGTVEVLDFGGNNRWLRGGASSAGQPARPAGYFFIRTADPAMCLKAEDDGIMRVRRCNPDDHGQLWKDWKTPDGRCVRQIGSTTKLHALGNRDIGEADGLIGAATGKGCPRVDYNPADRSIKIGKWCLDVRGRLAETHPVIMYKCQKSINQQFDAVPVT
jgi:hypothetical protein